ncbi:ATP-dependent DNA helicase RecQ [Pedobacter sp.]|uniref:RecQ family ATP-dependent DNA helicase n=1 Tax=Pedobacter sp. TaxID=1411316 RepID=UPI00396CE109
MTAIEILKRYWGHDSFRPLQQEIISSVLNGNDTLALLPTGGGKSVCFQVPALLKEGICIVISPLVALMKDQVENLKQKGINAAAIYGGMGKREIDILLDNCIYGNIKFLYLSPERLLSDLVRKRISYMNVNLIAVDEAHCISQWGYDFRPPYLRIAELRAIHPEVTVLALTATATPRVREDIIERLALKSAKVFVKSFARKNLGYVVFNLEDKYKKLLEVIKNVAGTGLIYVRNRRETIEVASFLNRNHIAADYYHAGLDKDIRFKKQEDWKNNKMRLMVATNAFGMGIDKADVRFVIHLDLPESLEAYYQEAGRAGRDEKKAYAVLLTNEADRSMLKARYADSFPTIDEIKRVYHFLGSFFQIAYGAGEGLTLNFDLASFCKRSGIAVAKTMIALKFLERDGYISVSDAAYVPSRLMFAVSHEDVYRFQIENPGYDLFIKTIQRSYGGAFDQYVKINENDLANRLKFSYNQVVAYLHKLQEHEIVSYLPQTDQPQLQFLVPRVDHLHLDIDVKHIKLRHQVLEEQISAVIAYTQKTYCRSLQLQHYFGEQVTTKCGVCDVCIAERKNKDINEIIDEIDFEIMQLLQKSSYTLSDLMQEITAGNEHVRLERIRELMDAGKIKSDGKKYYL